MKAALIFLFLLFGCGGDAAAKPCIPVDVIQFKTLGNGVSQADAELSLVLADSSKFMRKNFRFVDFCFLTVKPLWYSPASYVNIPANYGEIFTFWLDRLKFKYGHVLLGIHPVLAEFYQGGLAFVRSYLNRDWPGFAMAWCGRDSIRCKIIVLHEVLHTVGARHLLGVNVMNKSLFGPEQLVVFPTTRTQIRRYLKRKGLI